VKKIGVAIGVFFLLFIATLVIVPLMVDVDKYRPQLVNAVNQTIQGRLELGKLSLSLWGQIKVEVAGVKLLDSTGKGVVEVKNAFFHIPFLSVLSGSPVLTLKMNQPEVMVLKNKAGQLNGLTLFKTPENQQVKFQTSASASSQPSANNAKSPSGGTEAQAALPSWVTKARMGVELRNARVTYQDEGTGLSSHIQDLNLVLRDISLSHPMDLEVWANLDTKMGKIFLVKGPIRWEGKAQPTLKDGKLESFRLTSRIDLDSLEISASEMFFKKKGIPANVVLSVSASEKEAKIENFQAHFFNAELTATGSVAHLTLTGPSTGAADKMGPVAVLSLKSNRIEVAPWVELIPLLKEYELGGSFQFDAQANGPTSKLGYQAKLELNGLTAKAPQLKSQPQWNGWVHVVTNQVDQIQLVMKAPGNDLKIRGKVVSFTRPKIDLTVTSTGMDLDQLVVFAPPASQTEARLEAQSASPGAAKTPLASSAVVQTRDQKVDWDALLQPLRENQVLADLELRLLVQIAMLKAKQVKIHDLGCQLSFKQLGAGIDKCGLKVFSGNIQVGSQVQLKPKTPPYQFHGQVSGLDMKQAVESQMALFKNTITGKANFNVQGQGSSFNPQLAISHLKATGNFKVSQAQFATVDIAKMVSDGIGSSVQKIAAKVPGIEGKIPANFYSQSNLSSRVSGAAYESISSDFSIGDGKFSMPNFYAKAAVQQGIDLKGQTTVGMQDFSLKTTWDVIDTYNLTGVKDISVDQNGVKVDHIFTEGSAPFHFTVNAGCTIQSPCYSYTEVPEQLSKVALNNISQAVQGKSKEEIRKQAESLIQKAPPALQKQLNEGLKKWFH